MNENQEENLKKGHLLINRLEEIQYSYFNGRPEWTTVQKNDLKLFLAYTYYKYPSPSNEIENNNYEDHNNSEKIFQLYKDEFKKNIGKLYEVLEKEHIEPGHYSNIDVGVTIIHSICKNKCDTCHNFPAKDIHKYILIRLKFIDKCIYIDIKNSRNYSGWDQYLENNDLPEGFMFYPISGLYDGSKTLHQNITPASKTKEHILKCVDYASFGSISAGFIITACGCIFTLAAPITLAASVLFFGGSLFQIYRNIDKLADMYKHKYDLSGSTPWILWTNLAISTLGVLVAPCHALAAVTSEINTTIQSFSRALTIIRKSGCIAQCTLEVFRAALEFIDNDFKITPENVLKLCLELFIVTGTLMSSSYIKDILKLLAESSVWVPIYKTLEQIPYCLGQTVWNSVYFFKSHFAVFVERVTMFLAENLTVNNLLNSWKTIRHVFEGYQKQIAQLNVGDLLWHVVDGIAVDESVKNVLRGKRMVKLLENLSGKNPIRRALVKYSVDRVLQEAMKLQANRDDCVAESARHGETRTWKVDEEFCKCYGLDRCAMDQYALWAIFEVGMDAAAVMADYEEYASRPENTYDDEMVVNEACRSGWSAKGYTLVAPCGVLDLEMCLRFSEKINPQPHRYTDHKLVQPEPGVSLMFGISAYSINIVFFGIDMINDVPKMSICFFQQNRDSDTPISDHSGFKKLQAA